MGVYVCICVHLQLNLIPYNPNYAAGIEAFDPPDTLTALAFQHILRSACTHDHSSQPHI